MADYLEDPYADPARQQRSSGTKRRRKKSGEDDEDAGARVKPVGPKRAMDGNGMIEATDSEKSRFQCVRALVLYFARRFQGCNGQAGPNMVSQLQR